MRNRALTLSAAVFVFVCSGCVKREAAGPDVVLTYELWVPISVFVGGLLALGGMYALRENKGRYFWVLGIVGFAAMIVGAPTTAMDKLTLSDTEIHHQTGFYGSTKADVILADVSRVELTVKETRGRRGRKNINHYLVFVTPSGKQQLPLSNRIVEEAVDDILNVLDANNLEVTDRTGGR